MIMKRVCVSTDADNTSVNVEEFWQDIYILYREDIGDFKLKSSNEWN